MEKYISRQKGYEKAGTLPVIDKEKELEIWYITLYAKVIKVVVCTSQK